MSVLETPRIIFGGSVSWDPIVTNNYSNLYDEITSWTEVSPTKAAVEQFRQFAASSKSVPRRSKGGIGNWNPQGTHRSNFFDTEINGVDLGSGAQKNDSFVGSPVSFSGMLVDCEPYGSFTSQLFFDQMSLGIDGGCRILAPRTSRVTARYVDFNRLSGSVYGYAASVASIIWQTSFAKSDGLQIDAYDSPALQALAAALDNDEILGLTVQFNAYATHYYGAGTDSEITARENELVAKLAGGGFQPNPARSRIVGVVGLWRKGEPAHEPGDRAMLALKTLNPNGSWIRQYVATAHARLDGDNLTVDLSNSISEIDLQGTKEDLGALSFYAVESNNGTLLGTIDYNHYNRDAYLASAGIVTLKLDANQSAAAKTGLLQMTGVAASGLAGAGYYLAEQALRAIPCDPNLYLNYGENRKTDVLVLDKGVPVGSGINVVMGLSGSSPYQSISAVTNADGIATFEVTGADSPGQTEVPGFILDPNDTGLTSIDPQLTTYMYIRTYPDDSATLANVPPTFANVYKYCLANWNAMAPCMDNWLDLSDAAQVRAYGPMLKRMTDPANFESFRFMPVTRDMTSGERDLLYRFLDSDEVESEILESALVEEVVNQAELSRRMRRAT